MVDAEPDPPADIWGGGQGSACDRPTSGTAAPSNPADVIRKSLREDILSSPTTNPAHYIGVIAGRPCLKATTEKADSTGDTCWHVIWDETYVTHLRTPGRGFGAGVATGNFCLRVSGCMIAVKGYGNVGRNEGTGVVKLAVVCAVAALAMAWGSSLSAQEVPGCGVLQNAYGPFDYRDPISKRDSLPIVETFHFTPDVESLRRGNTGSVLGDLRYTLRAFPNHHRALKAMARYGLQGGQIPIDDDIASVDCYFERAITFRPDDAAVHVIYANYLFKRGERDNARKQYEAALQLAPDSVEINYVAGLYFVDVGDLARAKKLAKIAYDNGYPLPGLKNKIAAAEVSGKGKSGN